MTKPEFPPRMHVIHSDKFLSGTPDEAMESLHAAKERIDAMLARSCSPGMYEALWQALERYVKEETQVLRLIADAQRAAKEVRKGEE